MKTPDQPTRPTEAHYQLAHIIRQSSTQERAAQLIADSEARAVEAAIARWSGGFDMSLPDLYEAAKSERDKATAELATEREKVRVLRSALENLCDEQNGAPLSTREEEWKQAMDKADAALAATEGAK